MRSITTFVLLSLLMLGLGFSIYIKIPIFDRRNGVYDYYSSANGKGEVTIVFTDEDHPNKFVDIMHDICRFFKWGRIYDIESFIISGDKFIFRDTFCNSESFFQTLNLHGSKEISVEKFEKINDEPVVYVSTWNHMFSNEPLKGIDYLSVHIKKFKNGSRKDVEKIHSWRKNPRLLTTLIISLMILPFSIFTIVLRKKRLFFKVLTVDLILFLAFLNLNGMDLLIFTGLIFGLVGDILLELENKFLLGMLSFLVGHVFYILGFGLLLGVPNITIFLLCLGIVFLLFFIFLFKNLQRSIRSQMILYTFAITLMLSFSFSSLSLNIPYFRVLLPFGASLFILSDFILAFDRFVKNLKYRDFMVLFPYFLAQLMIALTTVFV